MRFAIVLLTTLLLAPPAHAQIATFEGGAVTDLDPISAQSTGSRILEQVLANDDMEEIASLGTGDIIRKLASPVGRLTLILKSSWLTPKRAGAYCTASLIDANLILTNHHCIPGNGNVSEAVLTMGYLKPRDRKGVAQYRVTLKPVEASPDLDYAILKVEGRPGNEWGTIPLSATTPEASHSLFLVHHPGGYPQYVSRGRCQTSDPAIDGADVLQTCDTVPGSSGAPIFDNNSRKVVGLHYSGVALKNLNAGKRIAAIAKASPTIKALIARADPETTARNKETEELAALRAQLAARDAVEAKLKADYEERLRQERERQRVAALERPAPPAPPTPAPVPARPAPATAGPKPGDTFRDCTDVCPEMVVVPAGSFLMGSPKSEESRSSDEGPQLKVTIAKPFAVGKFEVTFAEWDACVAAGGCTRKPGDVGWGKSRRPVIDVSWDDAKAYAAWLSKKSGQPYRLLTEAEWEYVARAGTTTPFAFGATISTNQANYNGNYTYGAGKEGKYRQKTIEVGSLKTPNAFGLHDMHGNVWEWVADCYEYSDEGVPTDGSKAPDTKDCSRVVRGGSWYDDPGSLRSANRYGFLSVFRNFDLGFRVARSLSR